VDAQTNTPAKPAVEPVTAEVKAAAAEPISVTVAAAPKPKVAVKAKKAPVETKAEKKPVRPLKAVRAKTNRKTIRQPKAAVGPERNETMTYDPTTLFSAFPAAQGFEKLFTEAAGRGEEAVKRSRKAAEELADLTRANVDAFVEAGRIAASGAQSLGQEVLAKSRTSVDKAADTVRTFAEAKTPADVLQIQSDYVRSVFDLFVEESSSFTESLVKLAGEAFEPLSNRANRNVERFNEIVA
jgi:phasin family protein